jgi:Glutathione S-transferase, C-terminal domain
VRGEVRRTATYNAANLPDFCRNERAVGQRAHPHRHVDVLVNKVKSLVGERQLDVDLGECREKLIDDRHDVEPPKDDWGCHDQGASRDRVLAGRDGLGFIDLFLVEKHGGDLLASGIERHHVLKWMFWAAEHFRQGPPALFNERIAKKIMGIPEDSPAVSDAEGSIRKFGAILDAHLADHDFVAAGHFTLADIDLAAPLSQMSRSKLPFDEFPNIMAWHARLLENVPAWRQSGELLEQRMAEIECATGVKQ